MIRRSWRSENDLSKKSKKERISGKNSSTSDARGQIILRKIHPL